MVRRYFIAYDLVSAYLRGDPRVQSLNKLLEDGLSGEAEIWISGLVLLPGLKGMGESSNSWKQDRLVQILSAATMIPVGGKTLASFIRNFNPGSLAEYERMMISTLPSVTILTNDHEAWDECNRRVISPEENLDIRPSVNIPLVDLVAQHSVIYEEIQNAIWRIFSSSSFVMGEEVRLFEKEFAEFCGVSHAVALNSGTDALHLGLRAMGVGKGDGVLTVSHTFVATIEAIGMAGAIPIMVDIEHADCCMSPEALRKFLLSRAVQEGNFFRDRITGVRLKALLPVHLYGQVSDMGSLSPLAEDYNLLILEDAAQAHGAALKVGGEWRRAGSFGNGGAFSFYPGKNLGAWGDGGAFVSNDGKLAERVRNLRNHGRVQKYEHEIPGWSSRMDALQAAVLRVKLKYLSAWNEGRRKAAARYSELLKDLPGLTLPAERPGSFHVYHLYVVRTSASIRDILSECLQKAGIHFGIHYPIPSHLQPAVSDISMVQPTLDESESASKEVLSLPMYPEITEAQQKVVAGSLREAVLTHQGRS